MTDHAPARGVLFEQSRPQRRHKPPPSTPHGKGQATPSGFSPVRDAAHVNAESTHYIAPVSVAARVVSPERVRRRAADQSSVRCPRGYIERLRALRWSEFFRLALVRESNPRQPDQVWCSTTELTTFGGRQCLRSIPGRNTHALTISMERRAPLGPGNVRPCLKSPKKDADRSRTCFKL